MIKSDHSSSKIPFLTMRCAYMLPCALPVFNQRYPNVRLETRNSRASPIR